MTINSQLDQPPSTLSREHWFFAIQRKLPSALDVDPCPSVVLRSAWTLLLHTQRDPILVPVRVCTHPGLTCHAKPRALPGRPFPSRWCSKPPCFAGPPASTSATGVQTHNNHYRQSHSFLLFSSIQGASPAAWTFFLCSNPSTSIWIFHLHVLLQDLSGLHGDLGPPSNSPLILSLPCRRPTVSSSANILNLASFTAYEY